MRSHQRLNVELDQKGAALYAGCTEHVGEAFQGVDARALDTHAVGEADPVELRPRQIEQFVGRFTGTRTYGKQLAVQKLSIDESLEPPAKSPDRPAPASLLRPEYDPELPSIRFRSACRTG